VEGGALRLDFSENFSLTDGPGLFVFLSNSEFVSPDAVNLGSFISPEGIQMYGCISTVGNSRITSQIEKKSTGYYNGGSQQYQGGYISEFKGSNLGNNLRGNAGDVVDVIFGQGNNFANGAHIRCGVTRYANLPYFAGGKFYECEFLVPTTINMYTSTANNEINAYYTDFYDCTFPHYTDGQVQYPHMRYSNLDDVEYSWNHVKINQSVKICVKNIDGVVISGVTASLRDKDDNLVEWIEFDKNDNKKVTGNVFIEDRVTNVDGNVEYYVNFYKTYLDPNFTIYSTQYSITTIKDNYYPFTLTLSKFGYDDLSIPLADPKKYDLLVTMKVETPIGNKIRTQTKIQGIK
jgi:hypothetical protein